MVSRAALLKRNPLTRTVRSMLAENAINPDRVDLDSVQAMAMGEKSVQVRAEVMVTVPLDVFLQGLEEAREQIDQEGAAAAAEAEAQRIADQGQAALEETADAEPEKRLEAEELDAVYADAEPERDNMDIESAILRGEDLEPEADIPVGDPDDDGF